MNNGNREALARARKHRKHGKFEHESHGWTRMIEQRKTR